MSYGVHNFDISPRSLNQLENKPNQLHIHIPSSLTLSEVVALKSLLI